MEIDNFGKFGRVYSKDLLTEYRVGRALTDEVFCCFFNSGAVFTFGDDLVVSLTHVVREVALI